MIGDDRFPQQNTQKNMDIPSLNEGSQCFFPTSREEIKETMRLVGLDPDLKRSFAKYSLGMKQKLGIAQALMEKTEVTCIGRTYE